MKLLFSILFAAVSCLCSAQALISKQKFQTSLEELNLKFKAPKGYTYLDEPDSLFSTTKGEAFLPAMGYKIISRNAKLLLGVALINEKPKGLTKHYTYSESNQLMLIGNLLGLSPAMRTGDLDTIRKNLEGSGVVFFDELILKKYNATYGGIAKLILHKPYRNFYKNLKILFFYKKGYGEVYQFYFYNSDADLSLAVKETSDILKFMAR